MVGVLKPLNIVEEKGKSIFKRLMLKTARNSVETHFSKGSPFHFQPVKSAPTETRNSKITPNFSVT